MADVSGNVKNAVLSGVVTAVTAAVAKAVTNVISWVGGLFNRKPKPTTPPTPPAK